MAICDEPSLRVPVEAEVGLGVVAGRRFSEIIAQLHDAGFAEQDIQWSENAGPPKDAEDFALEAVFVICNSGMKNTVARGIYERVKPLLLAGKSASDGFGHIGKAKAMDWIWENREFCLQIYSEQPNDEERLRWLGDLPWIGPITKYHLAKNFGAQVAKPDVHLQRLADREGCTPQALCERLAVSSGYKVATVDLLLWRACAEGIVDSRSMRAAA